MQAGRQQHHLSAVEQQQTTQQQKFGQSAFAYVTGSSCWFRPCIGEGVKVFLQIVPELWKRSCGTKAPIGEPFLGPQTTIQS